MQNFNVHVFKALGMNIHGQPLPALDCPISALEVKWIYYAETKMLTANRMQLCTYTLWQCLHAHHLCS